METRKIGRLFGACPFCKAENTLALGTTNPREAICVRCEKKFDAYEVLIEKVKEGNLYILSLIDIEAWKSVVLILPAKWQIPYSSIISKYMRIAAKKIWNAEITTEKEAFCFPDKELWIREYKFLIGFERPITKMASVPGSPTYDLSPMVRLDARYKSFFEWLESFMRLLFIDDLKYKDFSLGRGSILKLSENIPMHVPLARLYLYCALLASMDEDKLKVFDIIDSIKDDVDPRTIVSVEGRDLSGEEVSAMIRNIAI